MDPFFYVCSPDRHFYSVSWISVEILAEQRLWDQPLQPHFIFAMFNILIIIGLTLSSLR